MQQAESSAGNNMDSNEDENNIIHEADIRSGEMVLVLLLQDVEYFFVSASPSIIILPPNLLIGGGVGLSLSLEPEHT